MNPDMNTLLSSLMFAALCLIAGASSAQETQADSQWTAPPAPPGPPAPPSPPAPPAPPAPPPMPTVPAAAHQLCADKAVDSDVSYRPRPDEIMRGTCQRKDGKMVFALDSYMVRHEANR